MDIDIRYTSTFSYESPVRESQNIVRACPRDEPGQRLVAYHLAVTPATRVESHVDAWGTHVDRFGIREPHSTLEVNVEACVSTSPRPEAPTDLADPVNEAYRSRHWAMTRRTKHADWSDEMAAVASDLTADCGTPIETVCVIRDAVRNRFTYERGATHVGIDVESVWDAEAGVCQDFAHVTIALLRSLGLAARYVSGYLYAADPTHPNGATEPIETQTHAWVEVAIPGWGWWAIDPSNGGEIDERHVVIGRGRDYDDVSPIRGVYFGDVAHELEAVVSMSVVDQ
jgi:transglutaminase-like putative cysteine protease